MATNNQAAVSSPVLDYLHSLYEEFRTVNDGNVATYIPELAKADPNWFGICLVTATGNVYAAGDSRHPFTIQSISKPFVYGLALEDHGRDDVLKKVSTEPTGDAFNSISLEPGTGRPRNPMINAGAIATTALIQGRSAETRLKRLLDMFGLFAGRDLSVDEMVYRSESETGHRNRAIGYMLRNFDILTSDPTPSVELYFQQCSIAVTARDLATMAATLANGGVNPLTGKRAIRGEYVENVLSVMGSCGMYDYAGEWMYRVGIPAKSGVAGGILAVLPGQLGIGVFSPRLDSRGNSVRGIKVCDAISRHCDLHLFNRPRFGRSSLRRASTSADAGSNRVRSAEDAAILRDSGRRIRLYQFQGNLTFTTAEGIVDAILKNMEETDYAILDFKRALTVNESACRLVCRLLLKFADLGKAVLFTHDSHLPLIRRYLKIKLEERFEQLCQFLPDDDLAMEWCEERVLEHARPQGKARAAAQPADYELFEGLSPEELKIVAPKLRRRAYRAGETIINAGDEARELLFLASGKVSVFTSIDPDTRKRLATFSPGMVFGEMAAIDHAPRSATVVADTETACDFLDLADFDALGASHPAIKIKLLHSLAQCLCRRLRTANQKLGFLARE